VDIKLASKIYREPLAKMGFAIIKLTTIRNQPREAIRKSS